MIRTVVIGAAGRMGRRLVANIMESETLELAGALEYAGSPFLGQDAGVVAGCGEAGVAISADCEAVLKGADAVINFDTGGVVETTRTAVAAGCAVVIGTTALPAEEKAELAKLAKAGARIVSAYNMSVGVNLLFKLVKEAATILGPAYDVEIVEMHHNQKLDVPSGTALMLANTVKLVRPEAEFVVGRRGNGKRTKQEIGIHSLRLGNEVGTHEVLISTGNETLTLRHEAESRALFAEGALKAAEWLVRQPAGLYNMQDLTEDAL